MKQVTWYPGVNLSRNAFARFQDRLLKVRIVLHSLVQLPLKKEVVSIFIWNARAEEAKNFI